MTARKTKRVSVALESEMLEGIKAFGDRAEYAELDLCFNDIVRALLRKQLKQEGLL